MPREITAVIDDKGRVLEETIHETDQHPDYKLLGTVVASIYREEVKKGKQESA